jgi:hypothetical protein
LETLGSKNFWAGGMALVAQIGSPEFKPQYHQKKKKVLGAKTSN